MSPKLLRVVLVLLGMLAGQPAVAQEFQFPDDFRFKFEVPYVPTPIVTVDEMLRVAGVGSKDFVVDLGSGDGRIVITAATKFGARGFGVDLDEELIEMSRDNARRFGVEDRVRFLNQDLFKTDLSEATVITMYLLPAVVRRLQPELLKLRPGTRIVSHDFEMDGWKPDRKTTVRKNVMLWIVPADVAGRWQARLPFAPVERQVELILSQRYQEIDAHARLNGAPAQVWELKLEGDRISFAIVDTTNRESEATLYFNGRVAGDVIEGELVRGVGSARSTIPWRATRVGK